MFLNLFKSETKRLISKKYFQVFLILIIILTVMLNIYYLTKDKSSTSDLVYGVSKYESITELKEQLDRSGLMHDEFTKDLELAINSNMLTKEQIKSRQEVLKTLKRELNTLNYLYEEEIMFEDIAGFNYFIEFSPNSLVNYCINLITIVISIIVVIKLAIMIPSEIKGGQAKLTLSLPVTRTKYLLYRYLIVLLHSIILMSLYCILVTSLGYIMFSSKGVLVFATDKYAFGLGLFTQVLFQYVFSVISIFAYSIITFSISLIINDKTIALFISLFICFGQSILEIIGSIFISNIRSVSIFFIGDNFTVQDYYTDLSDLPVYPSLLILFGYILIVSTFAFIRFNRKDILN